MAVTVVESEEDMREYKASTKRGQALVSMGERCCWGVIE